MSIASVSAEIWAAGRGKGQRFHKALYRVSYGFIGGFPRVFLNQACIGSCRVVQGGSVAIWKGSSDGFKVAYEGGVEGLHSLYRLSLH